MFISRNLSALVIAILKSGPRHGFRRTWEVGNRQRCTCLCNIFTAERCFGELTRARSSVLSQVQLALLFRVPCVSKTKRERQVAEVALVGKGRHHKLAAAFRAYKPPPSARTRHVHVRLPFWVEPSLLLPKGCIREEKAAVQPRRAVENSLRCSATAGSFVVDLQRTGKGLVCYQNLTN